MRKLNVSLLSHDEVDRAYPLVQAIQPAATIDAWRRFAKGRLEGTAARDMGILSVRNEQDYIVGIGAYILAQDLLHGPILFADHFCALDIMDKSGVARALLRGMERLAEQKGCSAIHTTLAQAAIIENSDWMSNVLHERGHCVRGLQMCKLIPATSRTNA